MKSRDILVAGILSVQALCGFAENKQPRLEAKEISIQDAQGGVQKLVNRGLFKPIDGRKRNKTRRLGGKKGGPATPQTHKTGPTETTKLVNDEEQAVQEYYDTEYGNDAVEDHYYAKGASSGKKSGKKSSKGYYPEDDHYVDEPIATERVPMMMEAFQDATSVTIVPVFSDMADLTMPGTVFLYSDAPFQNKTFIGSGAPPSGVVQGSCSRTDPVTIGSVGYEGKAYCHFVYEFFDIDGQTVIATLTAEGPVANGDMSSLAITGGSGELRRTIGQIDLYPSTVDYTSVPPTITNDPTLDFLGDGMNDGYEVYAYLFVDPVAVVS